MPAADPARKRPPQSSSGDAKIASAHRRAPSVEFLDLDVEIAARNGRLVPDPARTMGRQSRPAPARAQAQTPAGAPEDLGRDQPPSSAPASQVSRGGPMRTGWNSTAAGSVQSNDRARSLPMLDVPGWLDSHRLPKAVAVVMALKMTARVRLDWRSPVWPSRQAMM